MSANSQLTCCFAQLRGGQLEVVQATLSGRDVVVLWATGQGKSVCFQLPALAKKDSTVLVVSPLISLMQDQVRSSLL